VSDRLGQFPRLEIEFIDPSSFGDACKALDVHRRPHSAGDLQVAWVRYAWSVVVKLTVDTNLINAKGRRTGMNTLERWELEGKVRLCAAQRLVDETSNHESRAAKASTMEQISEPAVWGSATIAGEQLGSRWGFSRWSSASMPGPAYQDVASVLFPGCSIPLTKQDNNDVMFLMAHLFAGNDIFVTNNKKDFIRDGRQAAITERFGTKVMTDDEAVDFLRAEHSWG
jgi:hypothetical protein